MSVNTKGIKELERKIRPFGLTIRQSSNHMVILKGEQRVGTMSISPSPSGAKFAAKNTLKQLKKNGAIPGDVV